VALEPAVGPVEVVLLDEELVAVLLDQVDAAEVADAVGDPRADEVRNRADSGRREQRVLAVGDVEAGEEHGRLARHRDARALEDHENEHSRETELAYHVDRQLHDGVCQRSQNQHGARVG
jgi:hypothetical protein